jgi:Cu(I)/Ag(I) efflux system membrane protein CusA/SilA
VVALWIGIAAWGLWAMLHAPIDAIPDLSDNQVIVFTDWSGRSPQEVEDQITYPLTVNLQGLPGVKVVRVPPGQGQRRKFRHARSAAWSGGKWLLCSSGRAEAE